MAATRDEARRASLYVASDIPLFAAKTRTLPNKIFTKAARSAENQPASRLPRKTLLQESTSSLPSTNTIKGAYGRVIMEEEELMQSLSLASNAEIAGEGSPSPAPRMRDRIIQREMENGRMSSQIGSSSRRNASHPSQAADDDITAESGSVSSVPSSLCGSEDTADEIDMKIKNHARDQERLDALLKSQKGLFSRESVGSRVTETAHTLVKKPSGSSVENEPGIDVRKTWGSKARNIGSNWLSRNMHIDSADEIAGLQAQAVTEPFVDWTGPATDAGLVPVENIPSIQEPTPPHSRPSSAQPTFTSSPNSRIWDADLDFTARSSQVSTSPQLKIGSEKLNDIRAREIESLNKRAVATSRLEEIKERVSQGRPEYPDAPMIGAKDKPIESTLSVRLREEESWLGAFPGFGSSANAEDDHVEGPSDFLKQQAIIPADPKEIGPQTAKRAPLDNSHGRDILREPKKHGGEVVRLNHYSKSASEPESAAKVFIDMTAEPSVAISSKPGEHVHEKTIFEEEGEHIHDTPITIFKDPTRDNLRDSPQDHKLEDSWEVLHRLSKLASPSPNPVNKEEKLAVELGRKNSGIRVPRTPPKSDVDPEERIAAEAKLFELPDNKSERNSLRAPSPIEEAENSNTPHPKVDPASLPTPIVTGAYIDTPVPTGRQSNFASGDSVSSDWSDAADDIESKSTVKSSSRYISHTGVRSRGQANRSSTNKAVAAPTTKLNRTIKVKPRLLSRTLLNTAKPASARDDLRKIKRESHIEDSTLDDFDQFFAAGCEEENQNVASTKSMDSTLLSRKERERLQEMRIYERMSKTLKIASLNIRDAKRGIERLEDRVSCTPDTMSQQTLPHAFGHVCCATCASSRSIYHLTIPIPRLWWRDPTKWLGIRFTWLGFISVILLSWIVSESITCEYICHPKYASRSDWSETDPFWGGALPTLIDRWSAGIFSSSWRSFEKLLVWAYRLWMGTSSGSASSTRSGSVYKVPSGGMESNTGRVWSEGYMFEDEVIK